MTLEVYDPIRHRMVPLDECLQLEAVDGYVPTRPSGCAHWFAVHMPTGTTRVVERVPGVSSVIRCHEATEALSRVFAQYDGADFARAKQLPSSLLAEARQRAVDKFGASPVVVAEVKAGRSGIASNVVAAGWALLSRELSEGAVLENTVRISELV